VNLRRFYALCLCIGLGYQSQESVQWPQKATVSSASHERYGAVRGAEMVPKAGGRCAMDTRAESLAAGRDRRIQLVKTSWYGAAHQGRRMANGRPFDKRAFTCANRTIPLGKTVLLSNLNGARVVLTVTDRGPFVKGRDLDISEAAAEVLGLIGPGVATFKMEVVQ